MTGPLQAIACSDDQLRRQKLIDDPTLQGLDYLEVATAPPADDQLLLYVHFVPKTGLAAATVSALMDDLALHPERLVITGGTRITDVQLTQVTRVGDHLEVRVSRPGDFSTYTLGLVNQPNVDPAYSQIEFNFKAGCPSHFDCKSTPVCPPPQRVQPLIDYMAKDYASFRQALLDFLPTIIPEWTERHEADIGIMLLELIAYAGDQLSYYQDAVSNEAYLATARQRISVRRHARLLDYQMHDGASARTFVHLSVDPGAAGPIHIDAGAQFLARIDGRVGPKQRLAGPVVVAADDSDAESYRVATTAIFESMTAADTSNQLNLVPIYTWGNANCCLPRGATSLDLQGDLVFVAADPARQDDWRLRAGSYLLLEEVLGPATGNPADADPRHRQVVRLLSAERLTDPLYGIELTHVSWAVSDALSFAVCISSLVAPGQPVSVARGNLVIADHGETRAQWHPVDPGWDGPPPYPPLLGIAVGPRPYRFLVGEDRLSQRQAVSADQSVSDMLLVDPHLAVHQIQLLVGRDPADRLAWAVVPGDLLDLGPFDTSFCVETDNDGRALVRFGDGAEGMQPEDGAFIKAIYRVGVGRAGNIGAEALAHLLLVGGAPPPIVSVRNPLAAWGGVEPEPAEQVKRFAPVAYRSQQRRAVTEADYARVAAMHPDVFAAVATFRWTGSWHTVYVTIDPRGREDVPTQLAESVHEWVQRFTMAGYDLEIVAPVYVPLDLVIQVCVGEAYFRADVEQAVLAALSNAVLPGGVGGFFAPGRFTFAQPLYVSQLYQAILAVPGADSAIALKFARRYEPDPPATTTNLGRGYINAARLEILRCDSDPNFPENGAVQLQMLGGK
jgi:hypothetical protein